MWKMPPSKDRWKLRSMTYSGIATAMAGQWK
ncbi:MAG TPA: DNA cytosine methyltransferase, partial [Myxococcales bacterium]|nr:DNA cytosine methyltransferase [Myxococcales bacterium]